MVDLIVVAVLFVGAIVYVGFMLYSAYNSFVVNRYNRRHGIK